MRKPKWKTNLYIALMLAPALLLTMGIIVYPIINTVIRSFSSPEDGSFTLANYVFLLTDDVSMENIAYTLWIVVVTVVLSILISYVLALYLRFYDTKISKFIGTIYLLPRFVPSLVAVYAMITIIRDSGFLNRVSRLFGYNFKPGLMYNARGIILMNLWFNIAFATMIIVAALSSIPDSMVESARDVGARKINVFLNMILPLSFKDVMIAMTFIFMSNVSSFTTPFVMGGNNPIMLGVYLRKQFSEYSNYEIAAALSVIMFLFSSVSAIIYIYTNLKEKEWEKAN
ncbi:ABC transporter permease [Sediminispirochaeta smaragdinae]|uniref:Binding-protein-dependent transport systems inner membrane component n=1 Tax=Sediminispirochaeta smaragdinae (strain DSM 11293 / JCM 15392 / SEBR 4228) TaxID=573413 RepID=E1R7B4_SEDSS|nr:ABC transporter permease subunit [Sediminispirochaeta smaragdinae]ADK82619.1 binding-protein-dependent transport systems inner membrane component [Sediminispirochaeta smaragdinae DSM 11293]